MPLRATYHLDVDGDLVEARAEALLLEQTVELPRSCVRDPFVASEILPDVEEIAADPVGGFRVRISYPEATTASDPAQLLNVLFGNSSLQPDVVLLDVDVPAALREALGGPRLGVDGLRALSGARGRALTCTALKPLGLPAGELARLAGTFARAGVDVVKDDHGLADHPFCRFEDRVRACQAELDKVAAETGHRAVYVPNLTGTPEAVERQRRVAVEEGVRAVLVAPMLLGMPLLSALARSEPPLGLLAHPAFAGALRIAPAALLGTLFRLYGADAVIYPHWGGRFAYSREVCEALARALRAPAPPLRPALPVPAGGMGVERAEELVRFYGRDAMLLVGGSLYEAGDALLERTRGFVRAVAESQPE